jgi:hypothetical protein
VPTDDELYKGIIRHDVALIVDTVSHLARTLATLHASGHAHGEVSDSSAFIGLAHMRTTPGAELQLGRDAQTWLATLGSRVVTGAHRARLSAPSISRLCLTVVEIVQTCIDC